MSWHHFELALGNVAFNSSKVTSVSRIPNSMEVWWIGANGSVQGAFWYEGGQWTRYELAPAGSASTNGGITALSRIPGSMEVWWIGANGSVQDAYWYDNTTWQRFELTPAGSASTNGGITAVSRIPGSMEVWWPGANGSIQDSYWYDEIIPVETKVIPSGNITTSDSLPLNGYADCTLRSDGSFAVRFHAHCSGADSIDYVTNALFVTKTGKAFSLQMKGNVNAFDPDDDQDRSGYNAIIRDNWSEVISATRFYNISGHGFLEDALKRAWDELIAQAEKALGEAIKGAIVALL